VKIEESIKLIRKATKYGINFIDTVYPYCEKQSEIVVGKAIKRLRIKVYLSAKNTIWEIKESGDYRVLLKEQLKRLDVDYIDFYHFYDLNEGSIRYISFSFHDSTDIMKEIIDPGIFNSVLYQYNILDTTLEDAIEYVNLKGLGVVIMGTLGGCRIISMDTSKTFVKENINFKELGDIYLYILDSFVSIHRELDKVMFCTDLKKRGISIEDEKLREIAISRYKNGEPPKTIYESFGKSKAWFFKWLKRYKLEEDNWAKSKSRKPGSSPKRIDKEMEETVIQKRKQLEKTLYSQIGAFPISYQLSKEGKSIPSIATINRIIKRNALTRKRPAYNSKGVLYPALVATSSNYLHQFDVIGPRYLKTGRFYSANIIDAFDRRTSVNPVLRQTKRDIAAALVLCFKTLGIPVYLQLDNKLPARGSNRYPHSFGLVIRLFLYLGIQPVFIPIKEPWRNGIVEHFNNVFDKSFFRAAFYRSFYHLSCEAKNFEAYHNANHRYSSLAGKTTNEMVSPGIVKLADNFTVPDSLALYPGYIHLLRFVRSNRVLDIFGEKYSMPLDLEYKYVWVTIDISMQTMFVYHDSVLVEKYSYPLPSSAIELSMVDL